MVLVLVFGLWSWSLVLVLGFGLDGWLRFFSSALFLVLGFDVGPWLSLSLCLLAYLVLL